MKFKIGDKVKSIKKNGIWEIIGTKNQPYVAVDGSRHFPSSNEEYLLRIVTQTVEFVHYQSASENHLELCDFTDF